MRYEYGAFDGQPFPTPDSLFPPPKVVQFILHYGEQALDALDDLEGDEAQLIEAMIAAGLLERDEQTGQLRMTPKMLRGIEHQALLEIFEGLRRGTREGHRTFDPGRGDDRTDGTRPYTFGDPLSELDVSATLRNALHRTPTPAPGSGRGSSALPLQLSADDFELYHTESVSDCATCVLIDMSGSMMRYGRFYQAKRVALGMAALLRSRFPQDTIDYVGFYSTACHLRPQDLPLVMPKPISTREYQVRVRVPLDEAMADPRRVPQHFTNLQLGLRFARQALARRGAANKQVFIITDGQPTAHVEPSTTSGGDTLHLLYPPDERSATATLREAMTCMQQGIRIASFALIEDYWGMDWVGFIDQLTRLTRGTAFYCSSEDLASTVIESYLSGRKKKSYIA
jgi:Ca-activated chloride channel family protein